MVGPTWVSTLQRFKLCIVNRISTSLTRPVLQYFHNYKLQFKDLESQLQGSLLEEKDMKRIGKRYSELSKLVQLIKERELIEKAIVDLEILEKDELSNLSRTNNKADSDMVAMISAEKEEYINKYKACEDLIVSQMVPKDDDDDKGVVLEVRAGTGGDEASLFASELFKMYQKYSEVRRWKWEQLSLARTEVGGFKEAQAIINGECVHQYFKYESGVHRVQRIPINSTKIQTSAASVIVLPEAAEVDVELRPQDLKIDVFRSQGAGGQSVNKTESAVRITHLPTGCVVTMQDERSQIQNRQRAMQYLRARVYDLEKKKAAAARSELRSLAHGTGDRSDKIRTYNFPQDRVTDHRIGVTVQGVERVLSGLALDALLETLIAQDEKLKLEYFLKQLDESV